MNTEKMSTVEWREEERNKDVKNINKNLANLFIFNLKFIELEIEFYWSIYYTSGFCPDSINEYESFIEILIGEILMLYCCYCWWCCCYCYMNNIIHIDNENKTVEVMICYIIY